MPKPHSTLSSPNTDTPTVLHLAHASDNAETGTQLDQIARAVARARRIVFVTGAGISCNAGIPDFRSDNGLYNMVKREYPDAVIRGADLFDAVLFSNPQSTSVFCTFMARLRACILCAHATAVHRLIKLLYEKNKLLRCYTQNIDGLERQTDLRVGVDGGKAGEAVVQLHGDIHELKCTLCCSRTAWTEEHAQILDAGQIPTCSECLDKAEERTSQGKRCPGVGLLRPNIVLYGEDHPDGDSIGRCITTDLRACPDLLIVAGTSLKVVGIRRLVRSVAKAVHANGGLVVVVNQTPLTPVSAWSGGVVDFQIIADCDAWVEDLRARQSTLFLRQAAIPGTSSKKRSTGAATTPKERYTKEINKVVMPVPFMVTPPTSPERASRKAAFAVRALLRGGRTGVVSVQVPPSLPETARKKVCAKKEVPSLSAPLPAPLRTIPSRRLNARIRRQTPKALATAGLENVRIKA
ncbi:DHS-like NAD/FAD-binding domain-containing protein [Limtongia smithiae]|uniref:DHS-like NAD/FAD-binding domain-containing protein n=1 Tax=Limtongia smithiae TaxID=1125753 RepID=UPI0034CEE3E8